MSTISRTTDTRQPAGRAYDAVDRARAALGSVKARIAALQEERNSLMATAQAELIAAGVDAIVVSFHGMPDRPVIGAEMQVTERWWTPPAWLRVEHGYSAHTNGEGSLGPYACEFGIVNDLGAHVALLIDGDDVLFAPIPGANDEERGHRLALGRLRTLARSEGLHVRARDLDIEVVDGVGTRLHNGTVLSAFAFILGVDLDPSNVEATR